MHHHILATSLVDKGTSLPDLPLVAGEHADPAHVHHGRPKVLEERRLRRPGAVPVAVHERPRLLVPEQRLVGVEERPPLHDQAVVGRVERRGAARHHLQLRRVVPAPPALLPQLRGVRAVQRRVAVAVRRVVAQTLGDRRAVRLPDRVGTWIHGSTYGFQVTSPRKYFQKKKHTAK